MLMPNILSDREVKRDRWRGITGYTEQRAREIWNENKHTSRQICILNWVAENCEYRCECDSFNEWLLAHLHWLRQLWNANRSCHNYIRHITLSIQWPTHTRTLLIKNHKLKSIEYSSPIWVSLDNTMYAHGPHMSAHKLPHTHGRVRARTHTRAYAFSSLVHRNRSRTHSVSMWTNYRF